MGLVKDIDATMSQYENDVCEFPKELLRKLRSELVRLYERDEWLSDLECAGVDNWQGMEEAISIREERIG